MDEESDASWLAVISSFEEYGSTEELLDALLNEAPPKSDHPCVMDATEQAPSPPPCTAAPMTMEPATRGAQAKKASKRAYQLRAKEEMHTLRHSVQDLEARLSLLQWRKDQRRSQLYPHGHPQHSSSRTVAKAWKGVASRQYQYLCESKATNEQLREQVQLQLSLIKKLSRDVERARSGLPSQLISPRITSVDEAIIASKRHKLLVMTNEMYDHVDGFTSDYAYAAMEEDFRNFTMATHDTNEELGPGAPLASSLSGHVVPHIAVRELGELIWTEVPHSGTINRGSVLPRAPGVTVHNGSSYQIDHREETNDKQVLLRTVVFTGLAGDIEIHGIVVRKRYCEPTREIVVTSASLSAVPVASRHITVSVDLKVWTVIQPHPIAGFPSTVVFHKIESSKPVGNDNNSACSTSTAAEKRMALSKFVGNTHRYGHDHIQCRLDTMLLAQMG